MLPEELDLEYEGGERPVEIDKRRRAPHKWEVGQGDKPLYRYVQ